MALALLGPYQGRVAVPGQLSVLPRRNCLRSSSEHSVLLWASPSAQPEPLTSLPLWVPWPHWAWVIQSPVGSYERQLPANFQCTLL